MMKDVVANDEDDDDDGSCCCCCCCWLTTLNDIGKTACERCKIKDIVLKQQQQHANKVEMTKMKMSFAHGMHTANGNDILKRSQSKQEPD